MYNIVEPFHASYPGASFLFSPPAKKIYTKFERFLFTILWAQDIPIDYPIIMNNRLRYLLCLILCVVFCIILLWIDGVWMLRSGVRVGGGLFVVRFVLLCLSVAVIVDEAP